MASTGLFVVTQPKQIAATLLNMINQNVRKTLYVHLFPNKFYNPQNVTLADWKEKLIPQLPSLCRAVKNLYSNFSVTCPELETCVLLAPLKNLDSKQVQTKKTVDVIIFDSGFKNEDVDSYLKFYTTNTSTKCKVITTPNASDGSDASEDLVTDSHVDHEESRSVNKIFDHVVLGGTFDRLHNGHKILLTEASLRCSKKLTIGVTDESMVKSKTLCELIEPCSERILSLKNFVEDMDPTLEYDIVSIADPFGPTKYDEELRLIVVSAETYRGGVKVNELRKSKGLSTLEIHEISLLQNVNKSSDEEEDKMSSSAMRMRLLGKLIKSPKGQPLSKLLPAAEKMPYIIGLTGGIACGKSSVASRLEKLGASIVNCDLLGHQVYLPGQECYDELLKSFGPEIVCNDGQINRTALGKIVFNDKSKLELLNSLVWPHIIKRVKDCVGTFAKEGKSVVIVEAAVLLQAKWDTFCNEVWACIIPKEEMLRRLKERTGLEDSECEKRVNSQPPNSQVVASANVVLSTQWSGDFTQKQVERAWSELESRVEQWIASQSS
ncbi:hypothetical protein J437_LFUL013489 [Ladona fulva]|uniref:Bifunctional coenzyme A synthase n=1 Tax=Ladona fulva TaxID=123851 RepID=A0A8K0KJ63_LADFU|nr:hypothetical protein J437_LFUL013489 [Ladona fulva]